jgi:DNA-binding PadR family transcriptional regulator
VPPVELDRVERMLLIHLLDHHGQQVRFEASQWITEFGIVRQFSAEPPETIRRALHALEMGRLIYRRTQYVVGYSEPKHVYSLTPSGHRKAVELREAGAVAGPPAVPSLEPAASPEPTADARPVEGRGEPEPHGSTEPAV